ncbi:hypothetical protein DVH24_010131 [Malus domestica]|uniref:EF-hand domain-containing protein n=1 Tax=Malus domestica TaxID=3750 RepID=A0A498JRY7_MALDO|nr:hypothetical protein DVH24_010131 [Malus domestica]
MWISSMRISDEEVWTGRINGNEAVAFFQGSAWGTFDTNDDVDSIWAHADQRQIGFLGQAEFYNALRLVTVAQSKRELTPEMVKAALYGLAAAKIPTPRINLAVTPAPQFNSAAAAPATQGGAVTATSSQNLRFREPQIPPLYISFGAAPATQGGAVTPTSSQDLEFRGPQIRSQFNSAPTATQGGAVTPTSSQNLGFRGLSVNVNQQNFISQDGKSIRPPVPPSSSDSQPTQGVAAQGIPSGGSVGGPQPQNSSTSNDWVGGRASGATTGIPLQGSFLLQHKMYLGRQHEDQQLPYHLGHRQVLGSDHQDPRLRIPNHQIYLGMALLPTHLLELMCFLQPHLNQSRIFLLAVYLSHQPLCQYLLGPSLHLAQVAQVGGQPQPAQSFAKANNQVSAQTSATGVSPGAGNSASSQSHMSWPRMTQTDVQKYTNIFVKVDTDRDGKITGEQTRDLFLKWGLPRGTGAMWLLKLFSFGVKSSYSALLRADSAGMETVHSVGFIRSDNDSMLSVREFCVALYLMERFREGRPLPAVLPSIVMFDLSNIFQPANNYSSAGNVAWRRASVAPSHAVERQQANQQKHRVPELEKHLVNQLSADEVNSLNSKFKEATEADKKKNWRKKFWMLERKLNTSGSKGRNLFCIRARCDNRLNEITERASADRREAESLAKKSEEKYKQAGDVASKLTIEEATFRDLPVKKMKLYRAIVKMEQEGDADVTLQDRVDHIQLDLDGLVKTLNERCKKYGLRRKPTTLTELPFGWQSGIQEGAADWDEDWDKFEDEGMPKMTYYRSSIELTLDVSNVLAPPKQKSSSVQKEKAPPVESPTTASSPEVDVKSEKPQSTDAKVVENGAAYDKNEDESAKSASNSPFASSTVGSPSREFSDSNYGKTTDADASP